MEDCGYRCPMCGQTERFEADIVRVYGACVIDKDGWDYFSNADGVELDKDACMHCCSCSYEAPFEEFEVPVDDDTVERRALAARIVGFAFAVDPYGAADDLLPEDFEKVVRGLETHDICGYVDMVEGVDRETLEAIGPEYPRIAKGLVSDIKGYSRPDGAESCTDHENGGHATAYRRGPYMKKLRLPRGCTTVGAARDAYEALSSTQLGNTESTHYRRLKDLRRLVAEGRAKATVADHFAVVETDSQPE